MNKRSAVLIAAGLVLTLAIGGLAVSLGLTGPTPVNATGPARPERVVKVERRTLTIQRKAGSPPAAIVRLSTPASGLAMDGSDDGYDENEGEYEGKSEHEDESHEDFDEVESEDLG